MKIILLFDNFFLDILDFEIFQLEERVLDSAKYYEARFQASLS